MGVDNAGVRRVVDSLLKWQARQCISVAVLLGWLEFYIVLEAYEEYCPSLKSCSGNRWNAFLRSQDCCEWTMISDQREFSSEQVLVKFAYTKYQSESLLLQLGVILFTWSQGTRGKRCPSGKTWEITAPIPYADASAAILIGNFGL